MAFEVIQHATFAMWLAALRDRSARGIILGRIRRTMAGNLGDFKPVGDTVHEFRTPWPGISPLFHTPWRPHNRAIMWWRQKFTGQGRAPRESLGKGVSDVTFTPFDPAVYLDNEETIAAYLADALQDGPEAVVNAEADVARARTMHALADERPRKVG